MGFAKKCLVNPIMKKMFPNNENLSNMETRNFEPYKVSFASKERFKKSPIIQMQNLLNEDARSKSCISK